MCEGSCSAKAVRCVYECDLLGQIPSGEHFGAMALNK